MIRPTSASKKIYSRQTLGLPFHCLNLALVVGEKKNKRERIHNKPLLTQVVHALYILLIVIRAYYKNLKY